MEEKKKSNNGYIIIVVVLLLLLPACFFAGIKYTEMISSKDEKKESKNMKTESEKKTKKDIKKTINEGTTVNIENVDINSLTVSSDKVINEQAKGWLYSEIASSNDNMGLAVSVDKQNNTGRIEIQWIKFNQYSIRFRQKNAQGGTVGDNVQIITVNGFKGNVHSAYITGFGHSSGAETAFFIMTDGTVEYVPIQKLYDTCGYLDNTTVSSYGAIPNVSGVAKIVQADAKAPQSTGSATTLGIKSDGTFYDFNFNLDVKSLMV